ncbi:MAG: ATP-binding cassette domain-containing protein [bacterium]|nr:ATP-binding cassette domain-containing protein [bacterium]
MAKNDTVLSFDKVTFEYGPNNPILSEAEFSVRRGIKVTLMGQNGAGKSTIFQLITGTAVPESGQVNILNGVTIATARQVIPRDQLDLTVRDFFQKCFKQKMYDIDPRIDEVLEVVNLKGHEKVHDRIVKSFSGGQQARLLLASALIQKPDLLLLDEPTNNLDKAGIEHLTKFLKEYAKTCIVISHDSDFLNSFTHGVLYLDIFTHKVEQYAGDYFDVVQQITARLEKENRKNAQLAKLIQEKKDQANVFANKGGQMRVVAKRMREKAEALEEEKVDIRKEDRTIRNFTIPTQQELVGEILHLSSVKVLQHKKTGIKPVERKVTISLKKNNHLLLAGPNGIGKSTLLEAIAHGKAAGAKVGEGVKIGYYRQDFSTLNFEDTVHDSLASAMGRGTEEHLRSIAAGFLITGDIMYNRIKSLSEGQKGLVAFARLVLEKPGLLILDEPTNHINFRHIPIIAEALNKYEGAMILVSHVPEFVAKIRIDEVLDLEK